MRKISDYPSLKLKLSKYPLTSVLIGFSNLYFALGELGETFHPTMSYQFGQLMTKEKIPWCPWLYTCGHSRNLLRVLFLHPESDFDHLVQKYVIYIYISLELITPTHSHNQVILLARVPLTHSHSLADRPCELCQDFKKAFFQFG